MHAQTGSLADKPAKQRGRAQLSARVPRMGKVVFSENSNPVHCAVKNFTQSHAVLTMSGWLGLPSTFVLFVEPDAIKAECRVIQRRGSNIKVEFTSITDGVRCRA
ncbi:MAG: hypothetical protein AAFN43_11730 [Pseudomonadota bacterium]